MDPFAPKIWDFAYPIGEAPPLTPTSSPLPKAFDAPVFSPIPLPTTKTTLTLPYISRKESDSSSTSSSSKSSTSSLATPPDTPKSSLFPKSRKEGGQGQGEDSMPAWARNMPEEVVGKDGLGALLFPTNSTPRFMGVGGGLMGRRKGINRPGHPVLKLTIEEKGTVYSAEN